jgi:fructose transport system ATP-binding protein
MTTGKPILRARGLMKRYGTVVAMNGADFDLNAGEIVAVIGDNGAGKSTLIKALSGAVTPDQGAGADPRRARAGDSDHPDQPQHATCV